MFFISLCYVRWINFWRLPESEATQRTLTLSHQRRVGLVRLLWLLLLPMLLMLGHPVVITAGVMLLIFLSFMFLDECS